MQKNTKLTKLLFVALTVILWSCQSSGVNDHALKYDTLDSSKSDQIVTDTTVVFTQSGDTDSSYVSVNRVKIDSTNHTKYLDQNGVYQVNWNILSDAKIELTYFPEHKASGYYAEFGSSSLFLREKPIRIAGYVIPFVTDSITGAMKYVLSEYPNSECFFCGGAGPQSVMEIFLKPHQRRFREDEYLEFKGRLVLNNGNPWMLNYLLYDAEPIE